VVVGFWKTLEFFGVKIIDLCCCKFWNEILMQVFMFIYCIVFLIKRTNKSKFGLYPKLL